MKEDPTQEKPPLPDLMEESPLLRGTRTFWLAAVLLLGLFLTLFPPKSILPDEAILSKLPLLTWRQVGWRGIGGLLIFICLLPYTRRKWIWPLGDSLTELFLSSAGWALDLAAHWHRQSRRWTVGLLASAIIIAPFGIRSWRKFQNRWEQVQRVEELRIDIQKFICYARLQSGSEIELAQIASRYGPAEYFPPKQLSTPALQRSYQTVFNLHELQYSFAEKDMDTRRRMLSDFLKKLVKAPLDLDHSSRTALSDSLTHIAMLARAYSNLAALDGNPEYLTRAEQNYTVVETTAHRIRNREVRQRLLGLARNGLGTIQVARYRSAMTSRKNAAARAHLLNGAFEHYTNSADPSQDGDEGSHSVDRKVNNIVDLKIFLFKETLKPTRAFSRELNGPLYAEYKRFLNNPQYVLSWVRKESGELERRARSTHNAALFLTLAQLHALLAEKLLRDRPYCGQLNPPEKQCSEVQEVIRTGFLNLSTSVNLGYFSRLQLEKPEQTSLCIYLKSPITHSDFQFLMKKFQVEYEPQRCP